MKTALNYFSALILISMAAAFFIGCSNSSGGPQSGGPSGSDTKDMPPANGGCVAEIPRDADNLTIAQAFNEYRRRCNPSEGDLQKELAKLK